MKKSIVFLFVILPLSVFCQGKYTVSAGVGFPNLPRLTSVLFKNNNGYSSKGNGPYHIKVENRLNEWFGLGININYMDYQVSYVGEALDANGIKVPNNILVKSHNTALNIRANFHLLNNVENEKWDLYIGTGLGYKFGKFKVSSDYTEYTPTITLPSISPIGLEFTIGARYFVIPNLGIYAEIGPAKSFIQFGLSCRF
ncbi:MAG: outer membrane beta-barrel protein [Bacteroidetes bacterium]|nr:outer membrane beta-barrel protein [Bacteroidota bacterium]